MFIVGVIVGAIISLLITLILLGFGAVIAVSQLDAKESKKYREKLGLKD